MHYHYEKFKMKQELPYLASRMQNVISIWSVLFQKSGADGRQLREMHNLCMIILIYATKMHVNDLILSNSLRLNMTLVHNFISIRSVVFLKNWHGQTDGQTDRRKEKLYGNFHSFLTSFKIHAPLFLRLFWRLYFCATEKSNFCAPFIFCAHIKVCSS